MKKLLLPFIITCAIFTSHAQTDPKQTNDTPISFGLRAGGFFFNNNAFIYNGTTYDAYLGVFSEIKLKKNWSLKAELNFDFDITNLKGLDDIGISIPVLLKYSIAEDFSIMLGPELMVPLQTNINPQFRGVMGLQYDISERFFIEGRYRYTPEKNIKDLLNFGVGFKF